jgi:hypothetical protein
LFKFDTTQSALTQERREHVSGFFLCGFVKPLFLFALLGTTLCGSADQVILTTSADTTLIETAPTNNLGAATFFNAGTTQNYTKNRGLLKFDIAGNVPRGSRITRVELLLEVTRSPADGYAASVFDLHRVLKPWGEGSQTEPMVFPGLGVNATTNEATWQDRFALAGQPWTLPGAAPGDDYAVTSSAEQNIYDVGDSPYFFGPAPQMIADAQSWLDDPAANHGWLLKTRNESINFTARRFGSREDANRSPLLYIDFTPPLLLAPPQLSSNQVQVAFIAQPGHNYAIEARLGFSNAQNWQVVTNLGTFTETTNVAWSANVTGDQRFFRLRQD